MAYIYMVDLFNLLTINAMKKLLILFISLLILQVIQSKAQDSIVIPLKIDKLTLAAGVGLDYGGFGGCLLVYPHKNIGFFVGSGYALAGFGYNIGTKLRFISSEKFSRVNFYLLAMYGYNTAIAVQNAPEYNKIFYGPNFGIGIDFHARQSSKGYWSIALLLPVRSSDVDIYIDDLKNNHNVVLKNELIPVAFSFGYRLILK